MAPPLGLRFAQPFIDVPRDVGAEMMRRFDEVLATLNAIPRGSTVWNSLLQSWLVLQVEDWRFHYKIDAGTNSLTVLAAARLARSDGATSGGSTAA